MERYTAFLEVSAYLWLTLAALTLGGAAALVTTRRASRRYPEIFRRRRQALVLILLIIAVLTLPAALFIPGVERFPPLREAALYLGPGFLIAALVLRFSKIGLPLLLVLLAGVFWAEKRTAEGYLFPEEGSALASIEVRGVDGEGVELFVELPPAASQAWLAQGGGESSPLTLDELRFELGTLIYHPYLWWRSGRTGYSLLAPPPGTLSGGVAEDGSAPAGASRDGELLLVSLGVARLGRAIVGLPRSELLMSRYVLYAAAEGPVIRRAGAAASTPETP